MTLTFRLAVRLLLLHTACFSLTAARAEPYPAPPNLPAIRARYPLDAGAEAMLKRNGFVVLDGVAREDLSQAYPHHDHDTYIFVTTDAMLQVWYALHRRLLTNAEQDEFAPSLKQALAGLMQSNEVLRKSERDTAARGALRRSAITLAVANQLMNEPAPVPLDIQPDVNALLVKIRAHSAHAPYPGTDYTQFTVRGHYADSPALSRYFLASLWLSRSFLPVDPAPGADPDTPLREAVALAAALRAAPDVRAQMRQLNEARQTLAGAANAVSVEQLLSALSVSLGKDWTLTDALQPAALARLRQELARPAYPRADVHTETVFPGTPFPRQIISLLPDFALPDSRLFQKTVNPAIPNRSLPTSLEVAAALGFQTARRQIQATDPRADAVLAALDQQPLLAEEDDAGTYNGWLRLLATLAKPDPRAPGFMQGEPWQFEKINTALASWAQLRHTYILYGAQTYTQTLGEERPSPTALVEPNPAFYQSLAELADRTQAALMEQQALVPKDAASLRALALQCRTFQADAASELAGTLTPAQSEGIEWFGNWLEQFGFQSGPLVADVATGMHGEVLHAATGDFHPLIVIPDRKTGTAYVGWTLSFYEFVKPDHDRLTDARWQAQMRSRYLRPDRPDWSHEFVASENGAQWQSLAPLRQAEQMFQDDKVSAAMALLRRTVISHPDTTLATECQEGIGQWLLENHQEAAAQAELLKCRRLPGGDAYDQARQAVRRLNYHNERRLRAQGQQDAQQAAQAQAKTLLRALPQAPAAARPVLERNLAVALARSPWDATLLREGAAACQTPAIRDALGYLALAAEHDSVRFTDTPEPGLALRAHALAFSQTAVSLPLRAAAAALTLPADLRQEDPRPYLAALKPYLQPDLFQTPDPALTLLHEIAGKERLNWENDPKQSFLFAVDQLRESLIEFSYYEGRFDDMVDYARDLPHESGNGNSEKMFQNYQSFPDFDFQPLRLFAQAQKLEWQNDYPAAADAYVRIDRQFPTSKIALRALWEAENAFRAADNPTRADEIAAEYVQQFPESSVALLHRAQIGLDAGDLALARELLDQSQAQETAHPSFFAETLNYGIGQSVDSQIKQEQALREGLKPLALAAGKPELLQTQLRKADPLALAETLSAALPARREEILWTLLLLYRWSGLGAHFLAEFPDSPHAAKLWPSPDENISPSADDPPPAAAPFPDALTWLVPLINRGPAYVYAEQARLLFSHMLFSPMWYRAEEGETSAETLNLVLEQARFVRSAYPGTRAAFMADTVAAQTLLQDSRPEAARVLLQAPPVVLPPNDPLTVEAGQLAQRAAREIRAKRLPDWQTLWTVNVGHADDMIFPGEPLVASPLLTQSLLILPVATGKQWTGLAALDAKTGRQKWLASFGAVSDMAVDGQGHLFCTTLAGGVAALDISTGRVLYQIQIDPARQKSAPNQAGYGGTSLALAGNTLVVAQTQSLIEGLSPLTGKLQWKIKTWWPAQIYQTSQLPAIIEQTIFWVGSDGKVHALDAVTGHELWSLNYPGERGLETSLSMQPVALDSGRLLIPLPGLFEVHDPRDGHLLKSVDRSGFPASGDSMACNRDWGMEWDGNGYSAFWNFKDFTRLPFSEPRISRLMQPAFDGQRVYLQGEYTNELRAVDLETGARLNWLPIPNLFAGWITVGEGRGYLISTGGEVIAFPLLAALPQK